VQAPRIGSTGRKGQALQAGPRHGGAIAEFLSSRPCKLAGGKPTLVRATKPW